MTLSILDRTPALIVIDLQKGIVDRPTVHPIGEIVERSAALASAFRDHGLPVVLVNVTGGAPGRTDQQRPPFTASPEFAEFVDAVGPEAGDHVVTKVRWGAFYGTSLDTYLRDRGVTQVVIVGVATSAGVESTARSAHEHGYHVVLPTDAMTDTDAASHAHSVERIFPRLAETTTTADVLTMLGHRRST